MAAEYQGNDLTVVSKDPLVGSVELVGDDDEVIELQLDSETAEDLISALIQFFQLGQRVS
ncbi:hypothetical protein FJW04_21895 [Mesorhizobium sp. B2-7-3]|uniref:hypothetical protein n=1 Tax=unclassified Mesorhizobium TaxID=325217 RepID=UPI001125ED07|nr:MULTISPECIES: hypothetical protein [unclassified Mesorhizobium]MBZ9927753.1 hypothetical protein [Mesorhizobium sp. BR1-1-4]TPJ12912.1 hypothetical protein FJW04_21895 [Mesorhizobium sp. B2-7-3]